jgi:hypothetical protein
MKVFQELKIRDKKKFISSIIEDNSLSSEWKRNLERENNFAKDRGDVAYCFDYIGDTLNKAELWIMEKDDFYTVTNIVPQKEGSLDKDEYNALLSEFIVKNLIEKGLSYEVSQSDVTLADLVGEEVSKKFYSFSRAANKSTGRSHPCDQKRWFDFVFSCLREYKYMIDPDHINFFLIEDGWDRQSAYDLSLDYENTYYAMKYALENR